jgi:hypothetical protein
MKRFFFLKACVLLVFSICFETDLFVLVLSVVLIRIRNTETNQKNYFLVLQKKRNATETDWVSVCFCLNWKNFFVCFVDNLVFLFVFSVCLETDLFVSVVSKWVKNTKTNQNNRNNKFLVLRNKPKMNQNRFSFGLFWFEPKHLFVCFENTLVVENSSGLGTLILHLQWRNP